MDVETKKGLHRTGMRCKRRVFRDAGQGANFMVGIYPPIIG